MQNGRGQMGINLGRVKGKIMDLRCKKLQKFV
jgi:hypothetical protein